MPMFPIRALLVDRRHYVVKLVFPYNSSRPLEDVDVELIDAAIVLDHLVDPLRILPPIQPPSHRVILGQV